MTSDLDNHLVEATRDVFGTMLGWAVETSPDHASTDPRPFELLEVNGQIGFGGQLTGSLFLSVTEVMAQLIGKQILGENAGPGDVCDAIGELTNMMAGRCKSLLSEAGCATAMSIPNVIRGQKLWASGRDVQFMIIRVFTVPAAGGSFDVILLGKMD